MGVCKVRISYAAALSFYSTNTYYEALQETIQKYEKEGMKHYD